MHPTIRRLPAHTLSVLLVFLTAGCDDDSPAGDGPQYVARCRIEIETAAEPPLHTATERGPNVDLAETRAWLALCEELELDAGCQTDLPEGLAQSGVACMGLTNFEGTGITLASVDTHTCTVNIRDRREVQTADAEVTRRGSGGETEDYAEVLCGEAITEACAELGVPADCTDGPDAAFRVVLRHAGRQVSR